MTKGVSEKTRTNGRKFEKITNHLQGKPPGLVVNAEDSRSKPWSLDVGSNPGLA